MKNRYFIITGPSDKCGAICERLEDEGMEVFSISSFMIPSGNQMVQMSQISSRISRDLPLTTLENEVYKNSSRLIKTLGDVN